MDIFVYGTLKRGYNMERIAPSAKFLVEAKLKGYKLYDLGAYPAMVEETDKSKKESSVVYGEVWTIHDPTDLVRLNQYEGQAYSLTLVTVEATYDEPPESGEFRLYEVLASTYIYSTFLGKYGKLLESGVWNRKG